MFFLLIVWVFIESTVSSVLSVVAYTKYRKGQTTVICICHAPLVSAKKGQLGNLLVMGKRRNGGRQGWVTHRESGVDVYVLVPYSWLLDSAPKIQ